MSSKESYEIQFDERGVKFTLYVKEFGENVSPMDKFDFMTHF